MERMVGSGSYGGRWNAMVHVTHVGRSDVDTVSRNTVSLFQGRPYGRSSGFPSDGERDRPR